MGYDGIGNYRKPMETIGKTWETIVNMGYDGIGNYRKNIGKTGKT